MHPVLIDPELMNHPFNFNPDLLSNFSTHENLAKGIKQDDNFQNPDVFDPETPSNDRSESTITSDSLDVPDFSDACLKFISDILLEEDLDECPASVQEYRALQATEKSLYDALGEEYSPSSEYFPSSLEQNIESPDDGFDGSWGNRHGVEGNVNDDNTLEANSLLNETHSEPLLTMDNISRSLLELNSQSSGSSSSFDGLGDAVATSPVSTITSETIEKKGKLVNRTRRKKNHQRDEGGNEEVRSNKQQASSNEDYVEMEKYDDILLSKEEKDDSSYHTNEHSLNEASAKSQKKGSKGRATRGKKQSNQVEEVDLRTLLSHCAQAVSSFDLRSANELLKQIRHHSSPYGDSLQRVAHHFAYGLEARLAGTGSTVSTNLVDARISSSEFLKAYRRYVSAVPFKRMSFCLANSVILKLAEKATKIHIIDFGVFLGLQWPCFIQALSKRTMGPPQLRITGIDYPQHGFRPAERVEATGRRLTGYCDRFNVPFRYQPIAQKWETIQLDDLKIESDELVIVNCLYRSGTLLDETVELNSPRDAFLRLIRQINPSLFIHGTVNGTFNAPFFITRFREALFHYSSIFDVFDATMPREDHERLLIESEIYGKELLNVVACEGAERIQRPETFKQWQVRSTRAGLRQLPLDRELLSRVKARVKANYHKDFVVDEDRHCMLQGWKGRIFCALSFWQPN